MTVELHATDEGKVLAIRAVGKLTKEDYEAFVPKVAQLIQRFGKVRILFEMKDFHGWNAGRYGRISSLISSILEMLSDLHWSATESGKKA